MKKLLILAGLATLLGLQGQAFATDSGRTKKTFDKAFYEMIYPGMTLDSLKKLVGAEPKGTTSPPDPYSGIYGYEWMGIHSTLRVDVGDNVVEEIYVETPQGNILEKMLGETDISFDKSFATRLHANMALEQITKIVGYQPFFSPKEHTYHWKGFKGSHLRVVARDGKAESITIYPPDPERKKISIDH